MRAMDDENRRKVSCRRRHSYLVLVLGALALAFSSSPASAQEPPLEKPTDPASIYAQMFDVTRAEAVRRLELQRRGANLVEDLGRRIDEGFAGVWFDNESGRYKVGLLSSEFEPGIRAVLRDRQLLEDADTVKVGESWATLVDAQRRLSARLRQAIVKGRAQTALSASLNSVIVDIPTTSNKEERQKAEQAVADERRSVARVREAIPPQFDVEPVACTYPNCTRPLRAGVAIDQAPPGSGCSSGFVARQGSAYLVMTSGHCFRDAPFANWTATHTTSGALTIGARQDSYLGPNGDYAIIRVNATSFWMGSPVPAGWISQWGGNHELRVTGTGTPVQGQLICRSGRMTQTRCGTIPPGGESVQVTYGAGWEPWMPVGRLVVVTGGNACVNEGDSGGPAWIGNTGIAMGLAASGWGGTCATGANGFTYSQVRHAEQAFGVGVQLG